MEKLNINGKDHIKLKTLCEEIRKIKCLLGYHEYRPERETCVCIRDDYHSITYRMSNKCIYCGKEYNEIVTIPYRNG